jgi:phosphopantetheinyl transferase
MAVSDPTFASRVAFSTPSSARGPRILVKVVRLDLDAGDLGGREGLTTGDLLRAAAIRDPRGRAAFLAARHALRVHLAARLDCPPEAVPLRADSRGKPHLAGNTVCFSVARSHGWAAIATSDGCSVGVDVEAVRPLPRVDAVVEDLFPPRGRAEVLAATPADRPAVFLRWWTRIEAAVKACGDGLDAAAACLVAAPQESCDAVPGLALAVAGVVDGASPAVEWCLPRHLQSVGTRGRTQASEEGA